MPRSRDLNKQHLEILKNVHSKTGIDPRVIKIIIKRFFWGLTDQMKRNSNITIRGLFSLIIPNKHRKNIKTPDQKYYTRKNDKAAYKRKKAISKTIKS